MQDFFKETNLRDKLQEQCEDLTREVDNLHSEKDKLRKQLADAQAAIVEKDKAISGGSDASPSEQRAHTILVEDMEKKFARETKQLEEQSQQLEEEKKAAQEREATEAAKASELQQVLDDLNAELEQQGRQWDEEKKRLVEQATQIEELTQEVTTLRQERDSLSQELDIAKKTLENLETKFTELEQSQSDNLRARDAKITELTKTVGEYVEQVASREEIHNNALQ